MLKTWNIFLEFVRSKLKLVDFLTKPLNKKLLEKKHIGEWDLYLIWELRVMVA